MAKLDIRFSVRISIGATGGPRFSTGLVILGSGFEKRNQNWFAARCEYDVSRACRNLAEVEELISFFRICKGMAHSFRFKDYSDFKVLTGQGILSLVSPGVWQLYKEYSNSAGTDTHKIVFPVQGTIMLLDAGGLMTEGGDYSIDYTTGLVTMLGSPTPFPLSWTGQFDRHCRFDTDSLQLTGEAPTFFRSKTIPIVEIKD